MTTIARLWRGATRAADSDRYLDYMRRTGLAEYRATRGNLGAFVLRSVKADEAEFLMLTFWESEEAVRRFAGEEPERAVFYPEDDAYLVRRELHVSHFEVAFGELDPELAAKLVFGERTTGE